MEAEDVVDHLFRHQAGRMVSTLTRIFGPRHVELAEEVVQKALLKALETWPFEGIPQNLAGWLMRVAKNRAVDAVRREASLLGKLPEIERAFPLSHAPANGDQRAFEDDQLSMIFLCCHPAFTRETQVVLTLKTVGGFSVAEIARASSPRRPPSRSGSSEPRGRFAIRRSALQCPPPLNCRIV